jgi:hypothetical protein
MTTHVEMYVGESKLFNLAVTQDGTPINIDGWTFRLVGVSSLQPTPAPLSFVVTNSGFSIVDAPNGKATMTIADGDTTGFTLARDTLFLFSVRGTEPGGAKHLLAAGEILLKLSADSLVA